MCGVAVYFCLAEGAITWRISAVISPRERNALSGKKPRNPLGDGYFVRLRCWLGSQSPLWGFSWLAALDSVKITLRATHHNFSIPCFNRINRTLGSCHWFRLDTSIGNVPWLSISARSVLKRLRFSEDYTFLLDAFYSLFSYWRLFLWNVQRHAWWQYWLQ